MNSSCLFAINQGKIIRLYHFSFRRYVPISSLFNLDIDQGIHKVKFKVAGNEKRKKLHEFSFSLNMANFEGF